MNIVNGIISRENLKEDLMIFGDFDADANGSNGAEFTSDDALHSGFDSDLEYWSDLAEQEYKNKENGDEDARFYLAINTFMDHLCTNWIGYYDNIGFELTDDITQDGTLVTFVAVG